MVLGLLISLLLFFFCKIFPVSLGGSYICLFLRLQLLAQKPILACSPLSCGLCLLSFSWTSQFSWLVLAYTIHHYLYYDQTFKKKSRKNGQGELNFGVVMFVRNVITLEAWRWKWGIFMKPLGHVTRTPQDIKWCMPYQKYFSSNTSASSQCFKQVGL